MRPSRTLVLALVLAVVAGAAAWQKGWLATAPIPIATPPEPVPRPRFQSAWATEQEWLVDRITRDIRDMASYAKTRTPAPTDSKAVKPEAIRVEEHLLSPRSYVAFARQALVESGLDASGRRGSSDDGRLLSALLDPRASVLVREDLALSRGLEDAPVDAGAHERAALLLGAFALRDCAGISTDARPALTRMTAHLAFARALPGGRGPGLAGRYAEVVLATLAGRQRDALGRVNALAADTTTPAERAWLRALRLRNTRDWRIAYKERGT